MELKSFFFPMSNGNLSKSMNEGRTVAEKCWNLSSKNSVYFQICNSKNDVWLLRSVFLLEKFGQ